MRDKTHAIPPSFIGPAFKKSIEKLIYPTHIITLNRPIYCPHIQTFVHEVPAQDHVFNSHKHFVASAQGIFGLASVRYEHPGGFLPFIDPQVYHYIFCMACESLLIDAHHFPILPAGPTLLIVSEHPPSCLFPPSPQPSSPNSYPPQASLSM